MERSGIDGPMRRTTLRGAGTTIALVWLATLCASAQELDAPPAVNSDVAVENNPDSGSGADSGSGPGTGLNAASDPGSGSDSDVDSGARAAPASASDAAREAALRSEAGRLAMARGELERAREDFCTAWELAPSAERFRDCARVLDALRRDAELVTLYRAYLAWASPDDPDRAEAQARLAVLEPRVTTPTPDAPPRAHGVLDEPWLWAVIAVAAAAGLGVLLFSTGAQGAELPIPGDDGVVVRTLVEVTFP